MPERISGVSFQDTLQRSSLPIPGCQHVGITTYDAGRVPTRRFRRSSRCGRVRRTIVLMTLIDDCGFGASSDLWRAHRHAERRRLANGGSEKLTRFHTTALCSPTRQALLTGQSPLVNIGGVLAKSRTSAPGCASVLPKNKAPLATTLKLRATRPRSSAMPRGTVSQTSPARPIRSVARRRRRVSNTSTASSAGNQSVVSRPLRGHDAD